MRILSKFDDYYDYISKVYGVDNKIVYNRPLHNNKIELKKLINLSKLAIINSYLDLTEHEVYILVVCDKRFLVSYRKIGEKDPYSHYDYRERGYEMFDEDAFFKQVYGKYDGSRWIKSAVVNQLKSLKYVIGTNDNAFLDISRLVGQPVYFISCRHFNDVKIVENYPILKDIKGFSKHYDPERLFMDLSYYIGNLLNENPDMKPPVVVSDKTKIVKNGFDLKISFRGK